jgi:hypothetical protein
MAAYATNAELLLASGRDAMSNLYDIYIIPPDDLGVDAALSTTAAMVIRAQDFTPPELKAEIYQNHYKMDFIDVPAPKISCNKSFNVNYRIDASFAIHNALRKWKYRSTLNPTMTDIDGDVGGYTYNGIWGFRQKNKVFGRVAVISHKFSDIFDSGISNVLDTQGYGIAAGLLAAQGEAGVNYVGWVFDKCWVESVTEPSFSRGDSHPLTATATFRFITHSLIGADTSIISTLNDFGVATPAVT